ncbi:hypothetical protein ORL35_002944 [Salmonella enterica]|nr:hypothetical protein [Salmonella enterica]ECB6504680.1 hypothetical protein [Salmonella enterica subsp. enterica serovar Corvallis]EBI9493427.1 hypothetical protein [Salmonella enterica]ECL8338727.1 hypothetical protein [Salmonella enterica]EDA3152270.1 hypothetical protein [Salmonella enterica subsp. enterica serovar Corvallis]
MLCPEKAGGCRKYTGKHRAARTGMNFLLLWPAFIHIRRGGILQVPTTTKEKQMISGIAHLFTQIKANIAELRDIKVSGFVDSTAVSCVTNRAVQICALDALLYEHRRKHANQLNGLTGKHALYHLLLLKYKWPLSVIRTMTLPDVLLALHDDLQFDSLPEGVGEYLSQIARTNYPVNFPDYLESEWDPDLSEKFLIEIQR